MNLLSRTLDATKVLATAITAAAALLPATQAQAQTYPWKPIRMVVPFTPGGITDIGARLISRKLGEQLGQIVVVDNKPGAGGGVGADAVAKGEATGYMLLFGTQGTQAANQYLYKSISYDTTKDFIAVHGILAVPNVVVTRGQSFTAMSELLQAAKAQPGKISFATPGNGTGAHLAAELFQTVAGVKLLHVPYRGSSPAITDLLAGNVDMAFDYYVSTSSHLQARTLRALAVTGPARLAALPDVPTLGELGLPAAESTSWAGIFAPRATPERVIERLDKALAVVMADPEVIDGLVKLGALPMPMGNRQFQDFVAAEQMKWKQVVEKSGATLD